MSGKDKQHSKKESLSQEHKKRISESLQGRVFSKETIEKMSRSASEWQKGRNLTEETNNKLSLISKERAKKRKRNEKGHFIKGC